MTVPTTSFAVAAFIVLALPGLVFAAVRRWLRGELHEDRNFGIAIARGVILSATLTSAYWAIFGTAIGQVFTTDSDRVSVRDWRLAGLVVLTLYIVAPAVLAAVFCSRDIAWRLAGHWFPIPYPRRGHASVPTAWDFAAGLNHDTYVRIRKASGDWVGGWYTRKSYVTTYPESPSIYIHEQYEMQADGTFGESLNSGVWVSIGEGDIVSWMRAED